MTTARIKTKIKVNDGAKRDENENKTRKNGKKYIQIIITRQEKCVNY